MAQPRPTSDPLQALETVTSEQLRGWPVGGWWRIHQGAVELKAYGGEWQAPSPADLAAGPGGLIAWRGRVMVREH